MWTQKNKKTFFGKKAKRKEVEQQQQRFVKTYQDEKIRNERKKWKRVQNKLDKKELNVKKKKKL